MAYFFPKWHIVPNWPSAGENYATLGRNNAIWEEIRPVWEGIAQFREEIVPFRGKILPFVKKLYHFGKKSYHFWKKLFHFGKKLYLSGRNCTISGRNQDPLPFPQKFFPTFLDVLGKNKTFYFFFRIWGSNLFPNDYWGIQKNIYPCLIQEEIQHTIWAFRKKLSYFGRIYTPGLLNR